MSHLTTSTPLKTPRFGHAWRDSGGIACATVHLARVGATLTLDSTEEGRAVIAAVTEALNAMAALPPAPEEGQP